MGTGKVNDGRAVKLPSGYAPFLEDLKGRIRAVQMKAAFSVNRELIALYWYIGRSIVLKQTKEGWGTKVIDRLAADLQRSFPGLSGFSRTNIYRMRAFYLTYAADDEVVPQAVGQSPFPIVPQAVGEIPWGHNVVLMEKVKSSAERLWYVGEILKHGWSRPVLLHHIEGGLHDRLGKAVTNFKATLPPAQSDLAQQTLKDPYIFDFFSLAEDAAERELERGLLEHIRKFLLELGVGFAFVGNQYHLEIEEEDFYLDLLFYHLRLRSFVIIDLKIEPFKPEFAGKMNFYLSAVDNLLRHPGDNPSIGIILCKTKKKLIAEYALRNMKTPIGVSEYKLTRTVPSNLRSSLPSVRELEEELKHGGLLTSEKGNGKVL